MISRIFKFLLLFLIVGFLFAGLWFRAGLVQEPLRTTKAALRLEISAESMIFANEHEFVARARMYSSRYMVCRKFESQAASKQPEDDGDMQADSEARTLPFGTYDLPEKNAAQPQALVRGTIIVDAGCVYLKSGNRRYLPLFPAQFTGYVPSKRVVTIFGQSIPFGTEIETNGGYVPMSNLPNIRMIDPIPDSCFAEEAVMVGTEAWR